MKKLLVALLVVVLLVSSSAAAVSAKPDKPEKPITPRLNHVTLIFYARGGVKGPPQREPEPEYYYKLLGPSWDLEGEKNTDDPDVTWLVNRKYDGIDDNPDGVPYVVNPEKGPDGSYEAIADAFEAWDAVTGVELFEDNPAIDYDAWISQKAPDGVNAVHWAFIVPPKAVAIASIWYYDWDDDDEMSEADELLDVDIVFNTKHEWGIDPDGEGGDTIDAFDVQNVATHEVGHVVGLDDLKEDYQGYLTMYGYTDEGEVIKRSLEDGDDAGAQELYGMP